MIGSPKPALAKMIMHAFINNIYRRGKRVSSQQKQKNLKPVTLQAWKEAGRRTLICFNSKNRRRNKIKKYSPMVFMNSSKFSEAVILYFLPKKASIFELN